MDEREALLSRIGLFVLDLDGTYYLGEQVIDGAPRFIRAVKRSGRKFLFLTNNSSKSPDEYIEKLGAMGCSITREEIMTSGDVTIRYLRDYHPDKKVFLLGTEPLRRSFEIAGIVLTRERPDIVVAGFDMSLTYEKLALACRFIREGALFLATHPDINCPVPGGFIPDCGAICSAITLSTGVKPKFLGKPFRETVDAVLGRTGEPLKRAAFVGDRLYTDVAAGLQNGAAGILVLTGETKREDLEGVTVRPSGVFDSLGEMADYLERGIGVCRNF